MTDQTDTQPDEADPPRRFWKTVITIYSPFDSSGIELVDLARAATDGDCFAPLNEAVELSPGDDPDFPWEFFEIEDDDEDALDDEDDDEDEGTYGYVLSKDAAGRFIAKPNAGPDHGYYRTLEDGQTAADQMNEETT